MPQAHPVREYNLPHVICLMIPIGVDFNKEMHS